MKQTLLRIGTNAAACMLFLVMLVISFSCIESPLEPVAPMSDIVLQGISIIDVTRTFADFLAKDTTLKRNPDGTSYYITSNILPPQGIPPIKLQPEPSSQQVGVGLFSVSALPTTPPKNVTLAQMGLLPIDYSGANAFAPNVPPPFPAYYISLPGDNLDFSSQFDYVAIHSGALTLTFTNNLPLNISFNRDIILRNTQDNSVIATFNFGVVDSFTTKSSTADLAGIILRSQLKFDSVSFSTEQRSTPFSLKSDNGINLQFSSTGLVADSALAVIPSQPVFSKNDSVLLVDSMVVVESAIFKQGLIHLVLVNNLDIDVGVKFSINEIKQGGVPYSIDRIMTAKQTQDIPLNFSDISMKSDSVREKGTSVKFSVEITTLNSNNSKKNVTSKDFVKASLVPQDSLVVQSIKGKIQPTTVVINSGVKSGIDVKDMNNVSAEVAFKGIKLTLRMLITGGFPTDYNLVFIAKNSKKNHVDSLQMISGSSDFPRMDPTKGVTVIQLSNIPNFDNFLGKFFPDVPDSFFVRGNLTMDPSDVFAQSNTYSIYDTTKVYPSFDLNVPFAIGINNGVMTEVVGFSKGEIPKDFTKSVDKGTLTFNVFNRIPLKMFFRANFLGNYNPITHKGDTLLPIVPTDTIQAASVGTDGTTTTTPTPTVSKVSISLSGADMVQFNKADSLYLRFDISTSNNGQVVRVKDTDYIRVYAKGDITYTVNKP
jgi:hypothetical protein